MARYTLILLISTFSLSTALPTSSTLSMPRRPKSNSVASQPSSSLPLNAAQFFITNHSRLLFSRHRCPENHSSASSSRTATPSSADLSFEWVEKDRRPHPFEKGFCLENGVEVRKLKCFEVEGIVVDSYLRADAKSHTIKVQLKSSDIDHIKSIIRTAPRHVEAAYRWPFEGPIAKFTSKDIKEDLARDFQPILDGRGINLKEYTGNLGDLTINDVMKGTRVSIEYMPVPYGGKKPKENDEGFIPGCALKLYSITVLEMTNEKVVLLDTSSPEQEEKTRYS